MSNTFGNPYILDTASSSVYIHPNNDPTMPVYVRGATYRGYTAASNKAILTTPNGTVIELVGVADLSPVSYYRGSGRQGWRGLKLTQLDGGATARVVLDVD